jgi:spoIIIJ-associated protein
MPEVERSAPSVEEAVEAALAELGVTEQEAMIEVLQEPKSGLFGVASRSATVRVRVAEAGATDATDGTDGDAAPTRSAAPSEDHTTPTGTVVDDQADIAADFVEDLLALMGIEADVEISDADGITYIDVWGEDGDDTLGVLIGRRGATLDGLQELVRSVVQRQTEERCQVQVDVEDYRKRRRSQVVSRAREAADKVKRSGRELAMEPMTSYERKIVHDTVADLGGLSTGSEGEEPNRRVVIRLAP